MKNLYSKFIKTLFLVSLIAASNSYAGGNTWSEVGDAPSFPDGLSQTTKGKGSLYYLFGETSVSDLRDAYCIKITDSNNFRVTSDANVDSSAIASFDTRLFLFDQNGKPILFNDDTPPSASPFASTLTGIATDGSGVVLSQAGEYTLVVGGFSDDPLDSTAANIYNQNADLVHSPIQTAGRFASWEGSTPATGSYILAMQGVEFCNEKLDIIGTTSSDTDSSLCFGDEEGKFAACNDNSSASGKDDLALGYFNKDKHLDVMFDKTGESPTLCLGAGVDGFKNCTALDVGFTDTTRVAMADINNNQKLDAVFFGFNTTVVKVCLGNGINGFINDCTDVSIAFDFFSNIDLAYMDTDNNIDLIVHGYGSIQICPGDGLGSFGTCSNVSVSSGRGLEVIDANNDNHLDIVTYAEDEPSQVCLNDGTGAINCSAMNPLNHNTTGIAMGDLNADGNVDAVFSNSAGGFLSGNNKVCLGDGLGAFTCTDVSGVAENHKSVSLGDLNGDGVLDVVFGVNSFARICYGVGNGTFTGCFNDYKIKVDQIQLGEFGDFRKWIEISDAPSYPDGQAQVTRGEGLLPFIFGSTDFNANPQDSRDAYCIKIDDPENFQVTSDANIDSNASANFDTRLFLFDKLGKPVLFNDDTPPSSSPFASTLTGFATDGSNFELRQAGEYILIVGGYQDNPMDGVANFLFDEQASLVHIPSSTAGHFVAWENSTPQTGNYTVALKGVSPCQYKLDIVGTTLTDNSADSSLLCAGDGQGGFSLCNNKSLTNGKESVTVGYLDQDQHLDTIFDSFISDVPSICLGNGDGAYRDCFEHLIETERTHETALGDVNNDGLIDIAYAAGSENHKVCLGDGHGNFFSCSEIVNGDFSADIKFAYMDEDNHLDLVVIYFSRIDICLGDGSGLFPTCASTNLNSGFSEIADFNGDGHQDIMVSSDGEANSVCLNGGAGDLSCSTIDNETNRSFNLAIGDLDNNGSMDVIFSNVGGSNPGINRVCLNDGIAGFICTDVSGIPSNYNSVKLGLLNDDNILDVVFVNRNEFVRVCMGNGDGTFSNCSNDTNLKLFDFELGEFGEFDVIFSNGFEPPLL